MTPPPSNQFLVPILACVHQYDMCASMRYDMCYDKGTWAVGQGGMSHAIGQLHGSPRGQGLCEAGEGSFISERSLKSEPADFRVVLSWRSYTQNVLSNVQAQRGCRPFLAVSVT